MTRWIVATITLTAIVAGLPGSTAAQDSLAAAKDLYAAAAYEDALKVLARIESPRESVENAQYQVFCLIALDRQTEAEGVIERMLEADPLFAPDRDEASPRVQELFDRVRTQVAPRLARALYADGKAALERKEHETALRKFQLLLQIVERTGATENSLLGELKLLAAGFVDLARAATTATAELLPSATTVATPSASAASADGDAGITRPVPITESFPAWNPSGFAGRGLEFKGVIRLRISAAGLVQAAEIVDPIHPAYDRRLLDAATTWRYVPARRGATPVESERLVAVHLKEQ